MTNPSLFGRITGARRLSLFPNKVCSTEEAVNSWRKKRECHWLYVENIFQFTGQTKVF